MLVAEVDLDGLPPADDEKMISIPVSARRRAESALEKTANLLAVSHHCGRSISSPHPCAYLMPEDASERAWLEGKHVIHALAGRGPEIPSKVDFETATAEAVTDREDGLALLAEALNHTHPTGRFHEIVRLFERAFKLGPYSLIDPLAEFLSTGPFGYTHDEVQQWITLRQPATHADRRETFVLEADVRPVIARMEQAAYDVLFNKATWRDSSTRRETRWTPSAGTQTRDGKVFIVRGTEGSFQAQILDCFGTYPLNLHASSLPNVPSQWWWDDERKLPDQAS